LLRCLFWHCSGIIIGTAVTVVVFTDPVLFAFAAFATAFAAAAVVFAVVVIVFAAIVVGANVAIVVFAVVVCFCCCRHYRLISRRLDKPILMAASTAYAKTLQQCTSTQMQQNGSKQFAKPPCLTKNSLVGITFDEKEFPALAPQKDKTKSAATKNTTRTTTDSQTASVIASTTATMTIATTQQPYDYKKELKCISHEIETKLKKQFETLFVQMEQKLEKLEMLMTQQATNNKAQDSKLDHFMQQHTNQKAEQDHFNETFTKWLDYLVVNMQRLLNIATPLQTSQYPLPTCSHGQL